LVDGYGYRRRDVATDWTAHATSVVADDTVIGDGSVIGPFCVIGSDGAGDPTLIGAGAIIRSHTVIYRGTRIGARFHAGHGALVREATVIGDDVSVGSHTIVEHHVELGDGVRLHGGCFVPELSVLEAGCWLGPGVILTNAKYPNRPETKANLSGVHIGRGAVVGAGALLLPGIHIGAGALVGAGAVVVGDVDPDAVVVGNPARTRQPAPDDYGGG
jgi:acetyltransferase-like isoleucine patch superfamily enzyme